MGTTKLATHRIVTNDNLMIFVSLVANYDDNIGYSHCQSQWEFTNEHKGGVSIRVPNPSRGCYEYANPKQTSLSELTQHYAKAGKKNAQVLAYKSLQNELDRDINCYSAYLQVEVIKSKIVLVDEIIIATDYEDRDFDYNHDKALETLMHDYFSREEYIVKAEDILNKLCDCK